MSQGMGHTLELLRRVRTGDRPSFNELLQRYQERLLERIRLMMGDKAREAAESEDFLQETLLETARSIDGLVIESEGQLLCWMTEVARNNIRDGIRKKREACFSSFSSSMLGGRDPSSRESPAGQAARADDLHRVAEYLEHLPEEHRRVIELRHFEDLAFEEIGQRMGRSANAVQLLHARALVRLGKLLEA